MTCQQASPTRLERLHVRAAVIDAVRTFFHERDFLEVETPVRLPTPALELHIDAETAGAAWLRTSPEFHLKRLVAEGAERVVEIGPCFRRGERGIRHNPEYTMLEWYRTGADYRDVMQECFDLLGAVTSRLTGGRLAFLYDGVTVDLARPWSWMTIADVFSLHAGWNPVRDYDAGRFDDDLVTLVEPALPRDRGVILADYPSEAAALARCRPDVPPVAERWELYLGGMELANAYSELTDAGEQRRRFEQCRRQRHALGKDVYEFDEAFLAALEAGLPECAGVALGIDRLVMLLTDARSIADVRAFCP